MGTDMTTLTALWGAVILSGLYHGVNPGMGWPLAVSAALMEGKRSAMGKALVALAAGHFLSMTAILLPFSLMTTLVSWEMQIRIGAGALVVAMGIYLLINRKHPRFLARVHPARLALWSFLAALAHGAGLTPAVTGRWDQGGNQRGWGQGRDRCEFDGSQLPVCFHQLRWADGRGRWGRSCGVTCQFYLALPRLEYCKLTCRQYAQ